MEIDKCCEILGILRTATYGEAKSAYRELASIYHPDKHMHNERLAARAAEKFKELLNAWNDLESHYKKLEEQERIDQLRRQREREREKARREEEVRKAEEARRTEEARKAKEEKKYILYTCEHCGSVNRVLRTKSFMSAKCGSCKKYLDKEREAEERLKADEKKRDLSRRARESREFEKTREDEEAARSAEAVNATSSTSTHEEEIKKLVSVKCNNCGYINKLWPWMLVDAKCSSCMKPISVSNNNDSELVVVSKFKAIYRAVFILGSCGIVMTLLKPGVLLKIIPLVGIFVVLVPILFFVWIISGGLHTIYDFDNCCFRKNK